MDWLEVVNACIELHRERGGENISTQAELRYDYRLRISMDMNIIEIAHLICLPMRKLTMLKETSGSLQGAFVLGAFKASAGAVDEVSEGAGMLRFNYLSCLLLPLTVTI